MARFDWPRFLRQHRIEYVTSGPNTSAGSISCKCPFCGENDPSQHLGISLNGAGWGCLRNAAHRGKSPIRLIRQLLHCSVQEAQRLVGGTAPLAPSLSAFEASALALRGLDSKTAPAPLQTALRLLPEFKPLLNDSPLAAPFWAYLRERDYRDAQIRWLAKNYGLYYAIKGLYAQRIVIPIYDRYGDLLSWTARTIRADAQPRYRTLRMQGEAPVAKVAANNTLLGLPLLWPAENPRALVLVEGPFDALKLTAFGYPFGVYATALFGLNVYPSQVVEVQELASRFGKVCLLLDEDAEFQRLRILSALSGVRCQVLKMPQGTDDPGALSGEAATRLALEILDE